MSNQKKAIQEIWAYGLDQLEDGVGVGSYDADLHNELYNRDYFIIGYADAEKIFRDVRNL